MVSLVREEVLALKVFRDPGDFQEHPELMDLRVQLDQLELPVLRVLLVSRECLVREEQLVFLELKVTEVTAERKDLKVLLAKMAQEA